MVKRAVLFIFVFIMIQNIVFAMPGDLDTSFNAPSGYVLYEPGNYGYAVAIQPDGKIVVAGASYNGTNNDVLVLRYNSDGLLDTTFGMNGVVTYNDPFNGYDYGYAVAIQPDGKIVVAGASYNGTNNDVLVLRYNSDGLLDTTFGMNGVVTYNDPFNGYDYGYAVAIQPDGKIFVTGYSYNGTNYDVLVLRYNSDGLLDTTFGVNGVVTYNSPVNNNDYGYAVAIQPDGKIVVAGGSYNGTNYDVLVLRYNSDGTIDNNFGEGDGVVTYNDPLNGYDYGYAVAIQPDGKIVVAGRSYNGTNYDVLVLRYNSDGTIDSNFGEGDGVVTHNDPLNGYDEANAVAIQPDGKIVVVGRSYNGSNNDVLVLRYNSDGLLDTTFGMNGVVTYNGPINDNDCGYAVAIQPGGKIVVAGCSRNDAKYDVLVLRLIGQELLIPPSQQVFSYPPIASPKESVTPALAGPIGVGSVAEGGDKISIRVGLGQFSGSVDIYFAIFVPSIDPNQIYLLTSGYNLQPLSSELVPWKENIMGNINESLFGDIPISQLPEGIYYLGILVSPVGSGISGGYYFWITYFEIP